MHIVFIGTGRVGAPLAARLADAGHHVVLAESREGSANLAHALARSPRLTTSPIDEAVRVADVVFLATPFAAVSGIVTRLGELLAGKIIVDCTNPVGAGLSHGLKSERSGSEAIQALAPTSFVVKSFSIYGFENFENPVYPDYPMRPAMLFCGNDSSARERVATLIDACGFEPVDVGGLEQALHLEHMTLLWVRMVRAHGHAPDLVWGAMRRLTAP